MRINLTALGRHTLCMRKGCAGDTPAFHFPVEGLRPCSQVIRVLYGQNQLRNRNEEMRNKTSEFNISVSA